jgi:hypothetical protein
MVSAMLGSQKRFDIFMAVGPTMATLFGAGFVIAMLFPSLGWLAGWLMLLPILLIGGALVFGVVANVIGHFLR